MSTMLPSLAQLVDLYTRVCMYVCAGMLNWLLAWPDKAKGDCFIAPNDSLCYME